MSEGKLVEVVDVSDAEVERAKEDDLRGWHAGQEMQWDEQ